MKILAFDTTTNILSISVSDGEKVLARFHQDIGLRHSAILISEIGKLLKISGLKLGDIDLIAISIGPGSFTGLRIALAAAKGFCLAKKNIKVIGVPTLDVIAYNFVREKGGLCPLLDARKNRVYAAGYKSDGRALERISDYTLAAVSDVLSKIKERTLFFGDGTDVYRDFLKKDPERFIISAEKDWYPKAENLAKLAREKAVRGEYDDIEKLAPMYLYPMECNVKGCII